MKLYRAASALAGLGLLFASAAVPASANEVSARVLGWYGNQPQSTKISRPFWENIGKKVPGLSAQFRTMDEIGLKGFEALRTLKSGAFDVESFQISFIGGEDPVLQGVDIPGLAFDYDQLKTVVDAYRPTIQADLKKKYNARLLAVWPFPFQIMFCKGNVKSMADLDGKKVRVSGVLSAQLVKQMGGTPVTLAGPEVYQALMQGVVDCAATGSQYGNANDWYEVTDSQIDLPIGGAGLVLTVARNDFWNKLSAKQQKELTASTQKMEKDLWAMALSGHKDGIACNTGKASCSSGKKGKMTLVEPSKADVALVKEKLNKDVLPVWAKDCAEASKSCLKTWNDTIGAKVGLTAKP